MGQTDIQIQRSWRELNLNKIIGVVLIVGGSNTGKTIFVQYLGAELHKIGRKVAYLDGDPGQSTFGPPTTLTVKVGFSGDNLDDGGELWRSFVGSISPKGHMLQTIVGAKRLSDMAKSKGAEIILYDTTGLIDPSVGGLALKLAKIDLLRPSILIAIQREDELNPLLLPLRNKKQILLRVFQPSQFVKVRDKSNRQEYRRKKYKQYFENSSVITINWTEFAVFPAPRFAINRLIALENIYGFIEALGIIISINRNQREIGVFVPEISMEMIDSIRLGDILLDPITFQDRYI